MSAFDFFFTFYSLLLGLTLVEIVNGFSRSYEHRARRPLGVIMPLLAMLLVMDVITQWGGAWRDYQQIQFANRFLVGVAIVMLIYYFAATQLFPRESSTASSLDEHFFSHRHLTVGGVVLANVMLTGDSMIRQYLSTGLEGTFWPRVAANAYWFALMLVIWFARSKRVVIGALVANLVFICYWLLK